MFLPVLVPKPSVTSGTTLVIARGTQRERRVHVSPDDEVGEDAPTGRPAPGNDRVDVSRGPVDVRKHPESVCTSLGPRRPSGKVESRSKCGPPPRRDHQSGEVPRVEVQKKTPLMQRFDCLEVWGL